jgi:hypothetical protein
MTGTQSTPNRRKFYSDTQPAVVLPAGRNYVEFEFKPTLFWNLLILQRATFLLLVVVGVWKLLRARLLLSNSQRPHPAGTV